MARRPRRPTPVNWNVQDMHNLLKNRQIGGSRNFTAKARAVFNEPGERRMKKMYERNRKKKARILEAIFEKNKMRERFNQLVGVSRYDILPYSIEPTQDEDDFW